jgi:hypothetical protein
MVRPQSVSSVHGQELVRRFKEIENELQYQNDLKLFFLQPF